MIDNIIPRTMENTRKCIKCGRSPAKDNVKLFRFPKPGVTNLIRCTLWAKYIFPEKEYASIDFQKKMHTEHRMLCHLHFKDADFGDESRTKLLRTSIPCDKESDSASHSQQNPFCDISNFASVAPQKQKKETKLMTKPSSTASDRENLNPEAGPSAGPSAGLLAGPSAGPSAGLLARPSDQQTKHNALLVKCRKYMQKVCQLRNRIKCLKQKDVIKVIDEERAVKKLSEKITPAFALLLQGQIRNFKKKITGRRWSKEEKITALRIYKRSPTCYRLLRRLFPLPSPSSLKTLLRRLPIGVGINKPVFNVLKRFTETQNPKDNYYTLLFDEMSLKKHFQYNEKDDIIEGYQDHGTQGRSPVAAGYALVFMVSGIRKKFKQPVAHYFSSGFSTADRLAVLIKEVLNECFEAGLNIVAIVCDMDGVNRRALNILGSSVQNPRIEINNREIITLFDTPHLLKCFRNLFMKYNIEINTNISSDGKAGKGIAKWAHIKEFHELDSVNPNFVYAPVLKAEHLNPNSKQKMKVNLAAQVLSHSVAGGMFARISNGEMSAEAIITANLVAEMDKLFDLLNAESPDLRRGKPFSTNWSKTSPHQKYLEKIKNFFETLRFVGSPRRPPSQDGWLTTINGFLKLKRKLEADNITSLATRRIQQDPIENLFGCIRGNCGSNINPTCGLFVAGLKTAVLSNLSHMGTTGNCETDSNVIINNFNTFLSASQPAKQIIESKFTAEGMPQIRDEDVVENSEVQACAYVCGFIVKKMKNTNCSICRNIFLAQAVGPEHLFVESREYNEQKKSLNYVTKALIASVESCANFVNTILKENGHEHNLRQNIKESMKTNIDFVFLNACVEHKQSNTEHIINSVFMICTKRFCVLKNRSFSREASAAALQRKMKIILHE